jgi:nuclear pore complex protein Nup107
VKGFRNLIEDWNTTSQFLPCVLVLCLILRSYCRYLRFFTHLCLYFRLLNVPVPDNAVDTILQAYINLLEVSTSLSKYRHQIRRYLQAADQKELVAQYSASLGDLAIDRYAMYLASLPLEVSPFDRIDALNQAEKHGLDVNLVAVRASETGAEKVFELLQRPEEIEGYELREEEPLTDNERYLSRCMEWTINSNQTYEPALRLSNKCIMYFLGNFIYSSLHTC